MAQRNWNKSIEMKDVLIPTATAAGTGFVAWIYSKLKTRREKKKSDIQLINEAISPLLTSIKQLTEQNNEMVCRLLAEQDKNLQLLEERSRYQTERHELIKKIDSLEKTVKQLQKTVKEYIKTNEE